MDWNEISKIRKSGNYLKARELARIELINQPNSLQLKSQIEWTYYSEIKILTTQIKQTESIDLRLVHQLITTYEKYITGETQRPGMAFSMILQLVSPFSAHIPNFYHYIHWLGKAGLRSEDWESSTYKDNSGTLRRSLPIAYEVARGLLKWAKSQEQLILEQANFCLDWATQARTKLSDEDAIWLDWDAVSILRRIGNYENASLVLSSVLKLKKSEFWVWAEAARIYQHDQANLALSCFCQAMLCKAEEKFLVSTHVDFAKLLIELEMYDEANFEVNQALHIRTVNQWKIPKDLMELTQCNWYSEGFNDKNIAKKFYENHSDEALSLCFDTIETIPATYLDQFKIKRENKKSKEFSRFSFKKNNRFISILANGFNNLKLKKGTTVSITLGIQKNSSQSLVINVVEQNKDTTWDYTQQDYGIINYMSDDKQNIRVFLNRNQEIKLDTNIVRNMEDKLCLGSTLKCFIVMNAKSEKFEIVHLELIDEIKIPDVKKLTGSLKKNPKGFGFVEDIFIPPHLITDYHDNEQLTVVAIFSKQKDKNNFSWRAIKIC